MTDGIIRDGPLTSTVRLSASEIHFKEPKITFDGDTFENMDDFYEYVRRLRALVEELSEADYDRLDTLPHEARVLLEALENTYE